MKLELYYPIRPWIVSQSFGENRIDFYKKIGMKGHNGIDVPCSDGMPILAAHDGVVTFTGEDGSGGLGVVVRTKEPFDFKDSQCLFKSIFWHVQKNSFKVKPGDEVRAGDLLALADNTGQSTAPHLHFGLKPVIQGEKDWEFSNLEDNNGYKGAIDPQLYFNGFYAEDVSEVLSIFQKIILAYQQAIKILKG